MSTGTIYHHLETLSSLIEQGKDKKYYLTELGLHAYDSLKDNIENIIAPDFSKKEFNSPILKSLMYLTPKKFINFEGNFKIYSLILSICISIIGLIFCNLSSLIPLFLLFIESPVLNMQIFISVFFIINIFLYYSVNEIICRLFYKKNENSIKFLSTFSLTFYPSIIYLIIHYIFKQLNVLNYSFISILDYILMILLQVWSLWLLTYNLIVNKHLKIENALIISLLIHYGGFSLVLALTI